MDCNSFNLYIYSHQLTCFTPLNDQNQKKEKFWILFCQSEYRNSNIINAKVLPERLYFLNGYTVVTRLSQTATGLGFPLATMRGNKRKIL